MTKQTYTLFELSPEAREAAIEEQTLREFEFLEDEGDYEAVEAGISDEYVIEEILSFGYTFYKDGSRAT